MKNRKIEDARRTLNESADRIVKEQCTFAPQIVRERRTTIFRKLAIFRYYFYYGKTD